ncbi:unnamed protein product, partial [marine sediment metagenome]
FFETDYIYYRLAFFKSIVLFDEIRTLNVY